MFTHVMVGTNDIAASKAFYDAVFGAIGLPAGQMDPKGRIFYRTKTGTFGITKPIDGGARHHAPGGPEGPKGPTVLPPKARHVRHHQADRRRTGTPRQRRPHRLCVGCCSAVD